MMRRASATVVLGAALASCGCALMASWPWQPAPLPLPTLTPVPVTTTTTLAPAQVPTPTPPPVPDPTPSPDPAPGRWRYPAQVAQVRAKVHVTAAERPDGRALMDAVALACGPNEDFPTRQCWPACGPEGGEGRISCDQSLPAYWIGGSAHRSNPWLRFAVPGETVRACVGADATATGTDVCSAPVEGR